MTNSSRAGNVPSAALIAPTLMITGRSASGVYAQPAPELARLTRGGAAIKLARGFYAAVPVDKRDHDWRPSLEDITAGIATAVYGPGNSALWGLSAARVHGALPRALSVGYAFGPTQHRPIALSARAGRVEFRKRDPQRLALEFVATEFGPGLVTSVAQTILDLSSQDFNGDSGVRSEAVRNLMSLVVVHELTELADRVRGRAALARARRLMIDAD